LNSRLRGHLKTVPTMVLSVTPGLVTGPMTISGYAWGHIVASGPRQLGRDIRVIDTHPRPLYRRKKQLTVKLPRRLQRQLSLRFSVVASYAASFILST
jgi:hypothetical protein